MKICTVTIIERDDHEMEPWVTSFSSREKAEAFMDKVTAKLREYGAENDVSVTYDSGDLDDEMYLDWVDARWEPEEEEE